MCSPLHHLDTCPRTPWVTNSIFWYCRKVCRCCVSTLTTTQLVQDRDLDPLTSEPCMCRPLHCRSRVTHRCFKVLIMSLGSAETCIVATQADAQGAVYHSCPKHKTTHSVSGLCRCLYLTQGLQIVPCIDLNVYKSCSNMHKETQCSFVKNNFSVDTSSTASLWQQCHLCADACCSSYASTLQLEKG